MFIKVTIYGGEGYLRTDAIIAVVSTARGTVILLGVGDPQDNNLVEYLVAETPGEVMALIEGNAKYANF